MDSERELNWEKKGNTYRILIDKLFEKRPLEVTRKLEDNTRMQGDSRFTSK
jgi:hypothetical protein